jgi:hypothetical protein
MKTVKLFSLIATLALLIPAAGCGGGGGSTSDPNRGFDVETIVNSNGVNFAQGARVQAQFQYATGTTIGATEFFDRNVLHNARFEGAKVPGVWRFIASGYAGCFGQVRAEEDMGIGEKIRLTCFTIGVGLFSASPDSVDITAPPSTGTVAGSGIDATYGMPVVGYYNEGGYLMSEQTATAVAGDGTWLQGPVPDFSGSYNGQYNLVVSNKNADASRTIIGTAVVYVTGFYIPPPPEPEPNPCYCDGNHACMECGPIS